MLGVRQQEEAEMNKIVALILSVGLASPAFAWNYDNDPYDQNRQPNYRYEGISGQKYQYDLSDPMDRMDYKMDLDAQMRDRINPDPGIRMDQRMRQYGGGAEW